MRKTFAGEHLHHVWIGTLLEGPWAARHHLCQLRAQPRAVCRPVYATRNFQGSQVRPLRVLAVIRRVVIVTQLFERSEVLVSCGGESHSLVVKLNRLSHRKAAAGLYPGPDQELEGLEPDGFALGAAPGQIRVFAGDRRAVVIREQFRKLVCAVTRECFDPRADLRVSFGAPRFGKGGVSDVSDQGVLEAVLGEVGQARRRQGTDEPAPLKRQQRLRNVLAQ